MKTDFIQEHSVDCPYCGETFITLINTEDIGSEYIEDCQICCKPIVFNIYTNFSGNLSVSVKDENQ